MSTLHITTSQRVIGKHRNMRRTITVAGARDCIERLALYAGTDAETREDRLLREELEQRTGCSLAELLVIAADWGLGSTSTFGQPRSAASLRRKGPTR